MKSQQLLKQLGDFLDMGAKKRRKKMKELKELLKALKQKEKKLIANCNKEPKGRNRKMINREIAVLHEQRKKGLKALKRLKQS
jgi:hypothetical protein